MSEIHGKLFTNLSYKNNGNGDEEVNVEVEVMYKDDDNKKILSTDLNAIHRLRLWGIETRDALRFEEPFISLLDLVAVETIHQFCFASDIKKREFLDYVKPTEDQHKSMPEPDTSSDSGNNC